MRSDEAIQVYNLGTIMTPDYHRRVDGQKKLHEKRLYAEAEQVPCRRCSEVGCLRQCPAFDEYIENGKGTMSPPFPRLSKLSQVGE